MKVQTHSDNSTRIFGFGWDWHDGSLIFCFYKWSVAFLFKETKHVR